MSLRDRVEEPAQARAEIGLDGGTLETGPLAEPIGSDWGPVLRSFGLDPAVFAVVGDTVRVSKWQQSKRLENGDRDVVWLWSYRAQFTRKKGGLLSDEDFKEILSRRNAPRKPVEGSVRGDTLVVCWADWQIGKSAGGGFEGVLERVRGSFDATVARVKELRKAGKPVGRICVALMGDPIEGCQGHYESQLFTVELTLRQQLLAALDLYVEGIRKFQALAPVTVLTVLSNHGEWMRRSTGGRSLTSDSDSADGFLADALQRILVGEDIEWVIPHDEMTVLHDVSGVPVAFTHGHKIPSANKELDWLRGQSIRLLREHGREPRVWVTAHRHHLKVEDMGPWWRLQCPSNDGGSKWFEDTSGSWSTPGTLTFMVGGSEFVSDIAVV